MNWSWDANYVLLNSVDGLKFLCFTPSALNWKQFFVIATEQNSLHYHTLITEFYMLVVHGGESISRENPIEDAIHEYTSIVKLNLKSVGHLNTSITSQYYETRCMLHVMYFFIC
jgi:hypothetical protein